MSLEARIAKLHEKRISKVNSEIVIKKDDKVVRKKTFGSNPSKVVAIIVRL